MTIFGFGSIGRPGSQSERTAAEEAARVREARVESARSNQYWRELEEVDLVKRGPYLVSASTDELFTPHRGAIFDRGKVEFGERSELYFFVSRQDDVVMLERVTSPASWSEVVRQRASRPAARAAS